jgi:hypothetical protein
MAQLFTLPHSVRLFLQESFYSHASSTIKGTGGLDVRRRQLSLPSVFFRFLFLCFSHACVASAVVSGETHAHRLVGKTVLHCQQRWRAANFPRTRLEAVRRRRRRRLSVRWLPIARGAMRRRVSGDSGQKKFRLFRMLNDAQVAGVPGQSYSREHHQMLKAPTASVGSHWRESDADRDRGESVWWV